jgi:transcriptional regulatory protein LevR
VLNLGLSNEAILQLVEQTQYQTLIHLSLKLRQANDDTLKRHLAARLKDFTAQNTQLSTRLVTLEEAYTRAQ